MVNFPQSTACPNCRRRVYLLCQGACGRAHTHTCTCLHCGSQWQATAVIVAINCADCGKAGNETEDDMSPGLCPACFARRLEAITTHFQAMTEGEGPEIALMWLEQALIEDANMREDWAPYLITRLGAGPMA